MGVRQKHSFRVAVRNLERERLGMASLRLSVASFPSGDHCVRDQCSPNKRFCLFTSVREWNVLGNNIVPAFRIEI